MSDIDEEKSAIVIDNGTDTCKAGFAGDEVPKVVFPSIVGKRKLNELDTGPLLRDGYVGESAQNKLDILGLSNPIQIGLITNWDEMEKLWQHVFNVELQIKPEDHPVLMTEVPFNTIENREKMAEIMLEEFKVPSLCIALQSILAVYAFGRGAGIVYDSGESISHVVLVHEQYAVARALQRQNFAGCHVTSYLARLLHERGYDFSSSTLIDTVRDIKEQICYVAKDFNDELKKSEKSSECVAKFTLPDGKDITIGNERFCCTESIFNPKLLGKDEPGAHEMIYDYITHCDVDPSSVYNNIILCGGNTLFPGFPERLDRELKEMLPSSIRTKVIATPERIHAVWIGGSIMASLSNHKGSWISRHEYEEHGSNIVHRKCIKCLPN